jgi:acyl-CoA thioester hydrolase
MDSFGHVNNTLYLRWVESGRIDYFIRARLWVPTEPLVTGPILAAVNCNYRIPVEFPDTVHIGTRVTQMGNSSFKMSHVIVSTAHNAVAADLDSTLVFYDYSQSKPTRLPDEIRSIINNLEGIAAPNSA